MWVSNLKTFSSAEALTSFINHGIGNILTKTNTSLKNKNNISDTDVYKLHRYVHVKTCILVKFKTVVLKSH